MTAIDSHRPSPAAPPAPAAHHEGHHAHGEYPFLAHHFESPAQQFDSAKLGMWVFLVTEVLFFGALFAMYTLMRAKDPQVFAYASHYLDTIMGGVNTCVLILSSLTMAGAVYCAQRSKKTACVICLCLTFLGAVGFLVIKYFEYSHKIHAHLVWGEGFYKPIEHGLGGEAHTAPPATPAATHAAPPVAAVDPSAHQPDVPPSPHNPEAPAQVVTTPPAAAPGAAPAWTPAPTTGVGALARVPAVEASTIKRPAAGPTGVAVETAPVVDEHAAEKIHLEDPALPVGTHRFFAIYYCMTGLHGIHVVVGMGLIGWLIVQAARGRYTSSYYTPVDLVGLYWHIVDLIWIFLFPLFYLIH